MHFLAKLLVVYTMVHIHMIFCSKYLDEECDRIRRPLHLLSDSDKLLYVEAFQKLSENKKLNKLSLTHAFSKHHTTHHASQFAFWHEYLLWEFETQVRALGGKFKCFSLPYWDFTIDSGLQPNDTFILTESFLGGNGNPDNNYCVGQQSNNNHDDALWSLDRYSIPVEGLCMKDEIFPRCCLKRMISKSKNLQTSADVASAILNSNFKDFLHDLITCHGHVHVYFGHGSVVTLHGSNSLYDPIFLVLHSYVMMLRLLWTSCWNYDMIDVDKPDFIDHRGMFQPFCDWNHECGAIKWDDTFDYRPLDNTPGLDWPLASKMKIQLKTMYNPIDWGIKYEFGNSLNNMHLKKWCTHLNDEWFVESDINTQKQSKYNHQKSDTQIYIDSLWDTLDNNNNIDVTNKFKMVNSLSCKYNRKYSKTSCWNEDTMGNIDDFKIETCNDRAIDNINDLSLDYILNFDGVKDNKCLQQIRINFYNSMVFDDDVNLRVCNGEFDYKCNEYYEKVNDELLVNNINMSRIEANNAYNMYLLLFSFLILSTIISLIFCWRYYFNDENYNSVKIGLIDNNHQSHNSYLTF